MNLKKSYFVIILLAFVSVIPFYAQDDYESKKLEKNVSSNKSKKQVKWYICENKKVIYGPFSSGREVIVYWLEKSIQSAGKYNIILSQNTFVSGKNYRKSSSTWIVTNDPITYFSYDLAKISSELQEYGNLDLSVPLDTEISNAGYKESFIFHNENIIEPDFPDSLTNLYPKLIYIKKSERKEPEPEQEPKLEIEEKPDAESAVTSAVTIEPLDKEPVNDTVDFSIDFNLLTQNSNYEIKKMNLLDFMIQEDEKLPDEEIDISDDFKLEVNKKDPTGRTALMNAVKNGNDWEIRNLLRAGASVYETDNEGWTPLMYAVRYQSNLSVLEQILTEKPPVKTVNNYGQSSLVLASVYNNNPEILNRILQFYSPSDREVHKAFAQLLVSHNNSEKNILAKIKVFIGIGFPLNSYYDGKTPLMYCCKNTDSTKVIKFLVDNGADITLRSTDGKTAFDYASENNNLTHDDIYWSLNRR